MISQTMLYLLIECLLSFFKIIKTLLYIIYKNKKLFQYEQKKKKSGLLIITQVLNVFYLYIKWSWTSNAQKRKSVNGNHFCKRAFRRNTKKPKKKNRRDIREGIWINYDRQMNTDSIIRLFCNNPKWKWKQCSKALLYNALEADKTRTTPPSMQRRFGVLAL